MITPSSLQLRPMLNSSIHNISRSVHYTLLCMVKQDSSCLVKAVLVSGPIVCKVLKVPGTALWFLNWSWKVLGAFQEQIEGNLHFFLARTFFSFHSCTGATIIQVVLHLHLCRTAVAKPLPAESRKPSRCGSVLHIRSSRSFMPDSHTPWQHRVSLCATPSTQRSLVTGIRIGCMVRGYRKIGHEELRLWYGTESFAPGRLFQDAESNLWTAGWQLLL